MNKALIERFWEKVDKKSDNECWEWLGYKFSNKYGAIKINGQNVGAHRVSYKIHFNDPKGFCVCHKCDNPSCVNPNHLFLGTHLDNAKDRNLKNRQSKPMGIKHPNSKLTEQDIYDIHNEIKNGKTQRYIAKKFGISQQQICAINVGRAWKHLI